MKGIIHKTKVKISQKEINTYRTLDVDDTRKVPVGESLYFHTHGNYCDAKLSLSYRKWLAIKNVLKEQLKPLPEGMFFVVSKNFVRDVHLYGMNHTGTYTVYIFGDVHENI